MRGLGEMVMGIQSVVIGVAHYCTKGMTGRGLFMDAPEQAANRGIHKRLDLRGEGGVLEA